MNNNEQLIANYDKIISEITKTKNKSVNLTFQAKDLILANLKILLNMYKNNEPILVPSYIINNTLFLAHHCNFGERNLDILASVTVFLNLDNSKRSR